MAGRTSTASAYCTCDMCMFEKLPDGREICIDCKLPIVENEPLSGSSSSRETDNGQTAVGHNGVLGEPNAQPSADAATERTQNPVNTTQVMSSLPSLRLEKNETDQPARGEPDSNPDQVANGTQAKQQQPGEPQRASVEGLPQRAEDRVGVREPAVTGNNEDGNSVRVSRLVEGTADSAAEAGGTNEGSASRRLSSSAGRLGQLPSTEERVGTAGCDVTADRMEDQEDGERAAEGEEGRHREGEDERMVRVGGGGEGEQREGLGAASGERRQAEIQASPTTGKSLGEWRD